MKRNLYLQHSLMAVQDPRMQRLLREEKLKGFGAYWFIVEKLMLMPDASAQVAYLKPFCNDPKIPFEYLQKIIAEYDLFVHDEDGYIMPDELNPARKTEERHRGAKAQKENPEEKKEGKTSEKTAEKTGEKRQKTRKKHEKTGENQQKTDENQQKTCGNQQKTCGKWRKNVRKCAKNSTENLSNTLKNRNLPKNNTTSYKENIRDKIKTEEEKKEKEKTSSSSTSAIVIQNPEEKSPGYPLESWRKMVDSLTCESEWLDLACMKSGYGVLLKRRIQEAVNFFKQHVEVYDKGSKLLNMSEVKSYFVNYVRAGTKTSQELQQMLLKLESQQQPPAAPDPYRYEQRVNGKRTYRGCPIPDSAPPRPNADAFWSDISHSWGSPIRTAASHGMW